MVNHAAAQMLIFIAIAMANNTINGMVCSATCQYGFG